MKESYIRFFAPVVPQTTDQLFRIIDQKIREQCDKLHLLISSLGGSVFHGISIYNYLKGAPIETHTYNFGSVDSIGVVIFCAGKKRYSVPHARFLMHGVRFNTGPASLDEKQLEENLKSIKIDQANIARIIAENTSKPAHKVEEDMNNRTTLNSVEAKDYGLVHDIKMELFPKDADLSVIGEVVQNQPGMPFQIQMPMAVPIQMPTPQGMTVINDNQTKSADSDLTTF